MVCLILHQLSFSFLINVFLHRLLCETQENSEKCPTQFCFVRASVQKLKDIQFIKKSRDTDSHIGEAGSR